jgi:hypothetical protein
MWCQMHQDEVWGNPAHYSFLWPMHYDILEKKLLCFTSGHLGLKKRGAKR